MTEAEWLAATDPTPMLEFLRGKASDRKLRLFAVACCRRVWHLFEDIRSRQAVETAESYADGRAGEELLSSACQEAEEAFDEANTDVLRCGHPPPGPAYLAEAITNAAWHVGFPGGRTLNGVAFGFCEYDAIDTLVAVGFAVAMAGGNADAERTLEAHLLRCIFGNPFWPTTVDPSWLTSTVVALAEGIYQERAFDQMPILADALQDAGCDDAEVLAHCRGPGPHVRGCWVVDLVLGKE